MKNIITAAMLSTAAIASTATASAQLVEINNLKLGGDVTLEHNFDALSSTVVVSPELRYVLVDGLDLVASTDFTLYDNELNFAFENPTLNLALEYALYDTWFLELNGSYNLETEERGDVSVKLIYSF